MPELASGGVHKSVKFQRIFSIQYPEHHIQKTKDTVDRILDIQIKCGTVFILKGGKFVLISNFKFWHILINFYFQVLVNFNLPFPQ